MATLDITPEQARQLREQCKAKIELRDTLHRLEQNPDFQKIREDYLNKEPVRLVHLLAEPSFNFGGKKELHREELHEAMIGIARFSEYIRNVYRLAEQAEKTLQDLQAAETSMHEDIIDVTNN